MSYRVASRTLPIICASSCAGIEPNSMLPKNDGATTMYQVFPRHLSRICFVDFEDKPISPNVPQHSQRNIKRFSVFCIFSLCSPCTFLALQARLLFHLHSGCFQVGQQLFFLLRWLLSLGCGRCLWVGHLLFHGTLFPIVCLGNQCSCCMKPLHGNPSVLASKLLYRTFSLQQ